MVGDTFIVGCALPDSLIFPEFNGENLDAANPQLTSKFGMYEPGCGLDNTYVAYGHDEYLYQVLKQNEGVKLPEEALYIIRYHSLYPWHDRGACAHCRVRIFDMCACSHDFQDLILVSDRL